MTTARNILTPTGRLVAGSLYEPQTKDQSGAPLTIKTGPDAGKPTVKWYFGLALTKTTTQWWEEPWGADILAVAQAGFPQGQWQTPAFAYKITDGDSIVPNKAGRKPCDNEGYPGHWVLNFSSQYAPKIYNSDGSALLEGKDAVKLGNYIQVAGSVDANMNAQNPGVYLNHRMVAFQGYHPDGEIVRGPDPTSVGFGKGPPPAGMVATPPGAFRPPVTPGAPAAPVMPAAAPPAPVPVTPHPSFLAPPPAIPGPAAPPAPPAAPAPPPPPPAGPQMTAKAAGQPYAAFITAGWTDAQLRANGYLV